MKVKKLPFRQFKSIYSKVPRFCVELIIKAEDGVLLTKRNIEPAKGRWHFPGGTVLMGEKLTDTAKRVAREELGVNIKVGDFLGMIEYRFKNYFSQPVSVALAAELKKKDIKINQQATEYAFFKKVPKNTIKEQKNFLLNKLGMR